MNKNLTKFHFCIYEINMIEDRGLKQIVDILWLRINIDINKKLRFK